MKKLQKLTSIALGAALLLSTACSSGGDGSSSTPQSSGGAGGTPTGQTQGRYVETEITPPAGEDMLTPVRLSGGKLVCYNSDYTKKWESTDNGESWTESELPGFGDDLAVNSVTIAEDGSLIAAAIPLDELMNGSYSTRLYRMDADGNIEPYSVPEYDAAVEKGDGPYIYRLEALPGGRLLLNFVEGGYGDMGGGRASVDLGGEEDDGAEPDEGEPGDDEPEDDDGGFTFSGFDTSVYDEYLGIYDIGTGEKIKELYDIDILGLAYTDTTLYLMDYESKVKAYSLETGERLEEVEGSFVDMSTGVSFFGNALAVGADGNLYNASNGGVQKLADGVIETLLDGSQYSLSTPNWYVDGLVVIDDGSLVVSISDMSGNSSVYRYNWDANATTDPTKVLDVWALEDNAAVRAAISEFRKKNPDATVNLRVAMSGEGGLTAEDAIKNLNTEIIAGGGPDIIILDGAPVDSYIQQGALADLTDRIDTSGIYQNLLDACKSENGLYYIPTRFTIPLLMGTDSELGKASTLDDLVQYVLDNPVVLGGEDFFTSLPAAERAALTFNDVNELFDLLWKSCAPAIVENGTTLNSEALAEFLQSFKNIANHYGLAYNNEEEYGASMAISNGLGMSFLSGSPLGYMMQRAKLGAVTLDDLYNFSYLTEYANTSFTSFPGLSENVWIPTSMVGINANSAVQELAADFVQSMLSESSQSIHVQGGFPITKAGVASQIETFNQTVLGYTEEGEEPQLIDIDFDAMVAGLKTANRVDNALTEKILAATADYCEGKTDLEGTVSRVEQELKNYLAERQ